MSAVKGHFDMLSPTNNINHSQRGWLDVSVCIYVKHTHMGILQVIHHYIYISTGAQMYYQSSAAVNRKSSRCQYCAAEPGFM